MAIGIRNIENSFHRQRKKLLRNLEKIENKKRRQFKHVAAELDKFSRREAILKKVEQKTSSHLKQVNKKISTLRRQDVYDKKIIKQMLNEIKKLKKEIPKIESKIKTTGISRAVVVREERKFSRRLSSVSSRVREIEKRKESVEKDLQKLLTKERMLKEGRIYWYNANRAVGNVKPKVSNVRRYARKVVKIASVTKLQPKGQVKQKKGIIERILFHPKQK